VIVAIVSFKLTQPRTLEEQFYSPEWQNFVAGKYGAPPEILYVDSPVMVDNIAGAITVD